VNGIIKLENNLGLIRSITKPTIGTGTGEQKKVLTLHLQLLSEDLVLHNNCSTGPVILPIIKQSTNSNDSSSGGSGSGRSRFSEQSRDTVMLKKKFQHQNITIDELNNAWVHGKIDWLPQSSTSFPNIMYCDSNKTCDVKAVDMTADSCPQWPCSCLNPWKPPH